MKFTKVFILVIAITMMLAFSVSAASEYEEKGMVEEISVVDGYFLNDFDRNVSYYDVYMSSFTYNLSVSVELTDSRFEYTISGHDTMTADNDSENVVTVTVYDPLGEYENEEYYLNIYIGLDAIEAVKWIGLSYLDVENGIFSPQFSRFRITYYAILENDIDSFEKAGVNYRLLNPDAMVEISCRDELNEDGTIPEGERVEYAIRITESNGKIKTYYLNLYRKAHITSSISDTAKLANITINGGSVPVKSFSSHKSYYEISVPNTITKLDIQAYPSDRSDIVKVLGPSTMNKDGAIFVNILVESPSEETFSIYTLRLEYDNYFMTKKYTGLELFIYLLIAFVMGIIVGVVVVRYIKTKGKKMQSDSDMSEFVEGDENGAEIHEVMFK